MKISGYIITKNNGKSLGWALESVYQYLDEIVIVDSGSSDNTIEIAQQYNAKIYFNEFVDFSAQRNFAISKCTGDWVFTMDADEVMGENFPLALKYLKIKKYRALLFPRYNMVHLDPCIHIKTQYHYSDWQVRLFVNDGKCYYENPVHHQLRECKPRLKVPNVNIFHMHWLMHDFAERKKRSDYYATFGEESGFLKYYLYEKYPHTLLKGIEKLTPTILELLKKELNPVEYQYKVNFQEQIKHKIAINLKTKLTKLRYKIGL